MNERYTRCEEVTYSDTEDIQYGGCDAILPTRAGTSDNPVKISCEMENGETLILKFKPFRIHQISLKKIRADWTDADQVFALWY